MSSGMLKLASDVQEYTSRKGWTWKRSGDQMEMLCPLCGHGDGKDNRFYLHPSLGVWFCHHCGEKGNLWQLKQRLGDLVLSSRSKQASATKPKAFRSLGAKKKQEEVLPPAGLVEAEEEALHSPAGATALAYLTETRGFTLETVRKFHLGYARKSWRLKWPVLSADGNPVVDADGKPKVEERMDAVDLVAIPYFANGKHVNTKYRTVPPAPKSFRRLTGCASTLFNVDALRPGEEEAAVVTEGELDVMSADQYGLENVVSGSTGAKGWDEEWLEALDTFGSVFLCYDNEEGGPGDDGAERLAVALGKHRCWRVYLPLKDFNECLAAGLPFDQIDEAFDTSKAYEMRELVQIDSLRSRLERARKNPEAVTGSTWGYRSMDKLLGGRRPELVVVTGDTGSGKTTFVNNLVWRQVVMGNPSAVFSFENDPDEVYNSFVSMEAGGDALTITDDRFRTAADTLRSRPLYLYDYYGEIELAKLKEAVTYAVRRKLCRTVVLDHLHYFLKIDDPKYERQVIENAMKELALWPRELRCTIILVVHPNQTENDNEKVGMNKLRGASAIKQAASTILRVWRKRTEDRKQAAQPVGWVTSLKVRSRYGEEGTATLLYDPASSQFLDKEQEEKQ
jgi:KaiC/GvpD/RAD55 family RecA-like ATPase